MSENRISVISIMAEGRDTAENINAILSAFGDYIVGRMGIPYRERGVSVICVVIDAPVEIVNTATGKLGMLAGVTAKAIMSKNK